MTSGPALPCPQCQRPLDALSWHGETSGSCRACQTDFDYVGFAADAEGAVPVRPQAALVAEEATCAFHPENRAEAVCDACGRMVCAVCAVNYAGQRMCPVCIAAASRTQAPEWVRGRTLFDGIALTLVALPLVIVPFVGMTLISAPLGLGMAIYGWNQPCSVVRGKRIRLAVAGLLAVAEIVGWVLIFTRARRH